MSEVRRMLEELYDTAHAEAHEADRLGRRDVVVVCQTIGRLVDRVMASSAPPPDAVPTERAFQARVHDWMLECFGTEITKNRVERNLRFLEEALELVQSNGCSEREAHWLVDYVFGRPVGDLRQEVGGVMVTLAALCNADQDCPSLNFMDAGETELNRVWQSISKIREKQAGKPSPDAVQELPEYVWEDAADDWMIELSDGRRLNIGPEYTPADLDRIAEACCIIAARRRAL